jgi:hypothetical protein
MINRRSEVMNNRRSEVMNNWNWGNEQEED